MLAAAAAVVITAFIVTTWLLAIAGHAKPGTDQANSRLDAVRTGLAAGAGAGAAVGLMLAFRRQHHQEIATVLTDRDATERRITELYTKAVEQLGNDKAPVRLGGLYALERLAQDNPTHRQTIVNVICAYLRMPFSPTAPASSRDPGATEGPEVDTWQQERQVRLAAQGILGEHLRDGRPKDKRFTDPPSPRFWPGIGLDLVGATLIEFNLRDCVIASADFSGATFSDGAGFVGATLSGPARFDGATFSGEAWFAGTNFSGGVWFGPAIFSGPARFHAATFSELAGFAGTTFSGDAGFDGATFSVAAVFDGATFSDNAGFDRATLKAAMFRGATFSGPARFDRATFSGLATFGGATFSGGEGSLSFDRSGVLSSDARDVWPTGWRLGPDGSGGYTVVRVEDDGGS